MPEYAWICLNKQGSEYAKVLNMIVIVHSLGSMYKVLSTYETGSCSEPFQTAKMELLRKNNYTFWLISLNPPS